MNENGILMLGFVAGVIAVLVGGTEPTTARGALIGGVCFVSAKVVLWAWRA